VIGRSRKRAVQRALRNESLRRALDKAGNSHFEKYARTREEIPWEKLKAEARAIRRACVPRLAELIAEFKAEAEKAGAKVHLASTAADARAAVAAILRDRGAKLVVKSKSMVSEEIGLNAHLAKEGIEVVETDLGEWIIQLAGERPSHITAPALHKTKEEVAEIFAKRLGRPVPADIPSLVEVARKELRRFFGEADAGISGANFAVAESGTLVIVSNEGNARLATTLPPVHIALVSAEKFVETLEQATTLLKALIMGSSGLKMTSYVSFITGPSKTTDIEKELVVGVHGPREVHVVVLDNGRLAVSKDKDLDRVLDCLKCGGCMLQCPVFQAVGGHVYGGPVYPGGIGVLLTAVTRSPGEAAKLLDMCADCRKCEAFCPVGIPTSEILLKLKTAEGPNLSERVLSGGFRFRRLAEAAAGALSVVQRIWMSGGRLRRIPLAWGKGKRFPPLKPKKTGSAAGIGTGKKNGKILLFQGCLVKFFFPEIRKSVLEVLGRKGWAAICPEDQACCGAPSHHLGHAEDVRRLLRANLKVFERERPDVILTVCPTGHSVLKKLYPELDPRTAPWAGRVRDFSEFMVERGEIPEGRPPDRGSLHYHHPCHYLNEMKLGDEPTRLLRGFGYEPKSDREPYACCGFCGVFSLKNPEIAGRLLEVKKARIEESGETLVATDCPGCVFQLKAGLAAAGKTVEVVHTAELVARALAPPKN
jgi:iron-sulfur cluster protein